MFRQETDHKDQLLDQFCGLFVQLHELDWRTVAGETFSYVEGDPYQFVDRWLQDALEYGRRFEMSSFDAIIGWLQSRRDTAPCFRPSLIHYDFHPANILVRENGSAVVIDWSGFDLSDSRFDLAWTLLLVGSYESMAWRDHLLQSYERHSGMPAEQLAFFEVSACVRRLAIILVSLRNGPDKSGMAPNAITLIKQQMPAHRRVYDLLLDRTSIRIAEIEQMFANFS
jgi:aminoglycoside phosphotransferase (APT) family kinase protein